MSYKMNISNELFQIKKCKTVEEMKQFAEDHNLKLVEYSYEEKDGRYFLLRYEDNESRILITIRPDSRI